MSPDVKMEKRVFVTFVLIKYTLHGLPISNSGEPARRRLCWHYGVFLKRSSSDLSSKSEAVILQVMYPKRFRHRKRAFILLMWSADKNPPSS